MRIAIAAALIISVAVCQAAAARLAVVSPTDESGAPRAFPADLPEGYGGFLPITWTYVDELAPLLVHGADPRDACVSTDRVSINVVVAQSMQQMADLDLEGALDGLDGLLQDLPCLREPTTSRELARIFYYRGAALAFVGQLDDAEASMRRALAIDADLPPDENLPREINDIFANQRQGKRRDLYVGYWLPTGMDVRVDGHDRPGSLTEGTLGLFQWQQPDGSWRSLLLEEMEDITLVGTPTGILEHLPEVDPPVARLASLLGARLAEPLRVSGVLFWGGEDSALLWDARANTTEWLDLSGDSLQAVGSGGTSRKPREKVTLEAPTDHARIAFAGGLFYIHPYPYAAVTLDANIRIYHGLSAGLGVDLGFPATSYRKTVVLPTAHVGLRYTIDAGAVHPWLGFCVRAALDDRPGQAWAMVGAGGLLGLDIPLSPLLMLRIWGEGGAMFLFRQGQVHGKIGVVLRI